MRAGRLHFMYDNNGELLFGVRCRGEWYEAEILCSGKAKKF